MKFLIAVLLVLVNIISAWDGERKGFLLGIGGGVGSVSRGYFDAKEKGDHMSDSYSDVAQTSIIGYAFNNQNALVLKQITFGSNMSATGLAYYSWKETKAQSRGWFIGIDQLSQNFVSPLYYKVEPRVSQNGLSISVGWLYEFANHTSIDLGFTIGGLKYYDSFMREERPTMFIGTSFTINLLGY